MSILDFVWKTFKVAVISSLFFSNEPLDAIFRVSCNVPTCLFPTGNGSQDVTG